jgi:hypothetical protein
MVFDGPDADDFGNVVSLNRAWLNLLRQDPAARRTSGREAESRIADIAKLSHRESGRLAEAPFLLFSFRERDETLWSEIIEGACHRRLFRDRRTREAETVLAAALGFVWQLSRRNPYALRLICGATLYWCERIGELTLYRLLSAVRQTDEIPVLRSAAHPTLWRKLLTAGVSPSADISSAAHLCALQTVLTEPVESARSERLAVAASRSRAPGLQVAEQKERHSRS